MIDNYSTTSFHAQHKDRLVLVTGATGYVGGRLVPELLAAVLGCVRRREA